jgi:hypothetical protein
MNDFAEVIRTIFVSNPYDITISKCECLYVYDDKFLKQTFMSSNNTFSNKSMQLLNPSNHKVKHICVDGGLIKHGLFDYVGDGLRHGRNDCMVFTDTELLIIELKMDVSEESLDKTRWGRYSEAMSQISDFYMYLLNRLEEIKSPMNLFFIQSAIHPIICMKNPPKASAQRNNEKEKFRVKTKLKIETITSYKFT